MTSHLVQKDLSNGIKCPFQPPVNGRFSRPQYCNNYCNNIAIILEAGIEEKMFRKRRDRKIQNKPKRKQQNFFFPFWKSRKNLQIARLKGFRDASKYIYILYYIDYHPLIILKRF